MREMSAYGAAVSLEMAISKVLRHYDVLLPPHTLKLLTSIQKCLQSFQNIVERLDNRSRKMMNAPLGISTQVIRKFEESLLSCDSSLMADEGSIISTDTYHFIHALKKMEKEFHSIVQLQDSPTKSNMVGLCDLRKQLKDDIVYHRNLTSVFMLVGMTGIGKTTLAREIFQDLDVMECFDCRVWVNVGDEWKPEDITRAILDQEIMHTGDGCVSLESKRCLIVLDDVFVEPGDQRIKDYLNRSFPDNINGSRVLLTTRMIHIARGVSFNLCLLNEEESWYLLRDRVFDGQCCPAQLEDVGKKIAEKCDGLPLTILTVADLLRKIPPSHWIHVAKEKKHRLFVEAYDKISEVLSPVYSKLPNGLKSHFVYMGVFPHMYKIPRSKLINLWIAEDIRELSKNKDPESLAAQILFYFYGHSLAIVHERSISVTPSLPTLGIKTCRLHSSWWHFCQRVATRNKFFHVLECYDDGFGEGIRGQRRLSVHNNVLFAIKDVHNSIKENCVSSAKSLLCFGPYNQYMVPICFGLKLLERVDALNIRFYDFPIQVLEMAELRYLALTCSGELPPSISKLQKLQYLIVDCHMMIKSCRASSNLPSEIWDMKTLKHLRVMGRDLPRSGDASLQKLSTLLDVSTASCPVLERVPSLKKLGIRIELTPDDVVEPSGCIDHISHLDKLESLKCVIVNPENKYKIVSPVGSFPILPFSLKKLSLSGLGYPWKETSKIASLTNLEVLKLRRNAFRGPQWQVKENGFQKLHYIMIEDMDLVKLNGGGGSFRSLKHVSIKHCYKLEKFHLHHYFKNIWWIELVDCNPLVEVNIKTSLVYQEYDKRPKKVITKYSWKS